MTNLYCSTCNRITKNITLDTRELKSYVQRTKKCLMCGCKFKTYEYIANKKIFKRRQKP